MSRILIPLLLVFLAVAGCSARVAPDTEPQSEDERIAAAVLRALRDDDEIVFEDLRVETLDGIVTLSGVQPSLEQVQRVIERVSRVAGVRLIVNRIRVIGGGPALRGQPNQSLSP